MGRLTPARPAARRQRACGRARPDQDEAGDGLRHSHDQRPTFEFQLRLHGKYCTAETQGPGPRCQPGHLPEEQLDAALTKVLTAHVRLGFFDDPSEVAYKRLLPAEVIDTPPHRALAKWAASRVVVLRDVGETVILLHPLSLD